DLVSLQDVLERLDLEAESVRDTEQHQDFVGPVAVAVNLDVALEDVGEGFEPQVPARLGCLLAGLLRGGVLVPLLAVLLGLGEGADVDGLDAEARVREAAVRALHVLAEGELYAARAIRDGQLPAGPAVF